MNSISLLKTCRCSIDWTASRKWQTGRFHSQTTKIYLTDVFITGLINQCACKKSACHSLIDNASELKIKIRPRKNLRGLF